MNTLGMRQDELNEKVNLTNELVVEEQTEKENAKKKKRMEMKFPEFNPKLDTLDLDPPDIFTRKQKRKKYTLPLSCQSLPHSYPVILNNCTFQ